MRVTKKTKAPAPIVIEEPAQEPATVTATVSAPHYPLWLELALLPAYVAAASLRYAGL